MKEEEFMYDLYFKIRVQEYQLSKWFSRLISITNELQKEYNSVYQNVFYIKIYELFTSGLDYSEKVYSIVEKSNNTEKIEYYRTIINSVEKIKSVLTDNEIQFIEYKRNNVCHIFQNGYEKELKKNGDIKSKRKGVEINTIKNDFDKLLSKHGNDKDLDIFLFNKSSPLIQEFYENIKKVQK
jgi:DNA gyrase/topoisomerase IV subunit A